MQKLDSTKIEGALKSLGNAGKNAVAALNAMTDGEFKGSTMETDPLGNLGMIVRVLLNAQAKAEANAKYDGMDADQISEAQAAERAEEQATIAAKFNEKLASRRPAPEVATEEPTKGETTSELDKDLGNSDDQTQQ
ncbi:MAG: hypothetical protein EOO88_31920 [Pedobacter sp.]|nr:MAG: hypothetical protein EOO88_31920 [Pedobacter sp.]